MRRRRRSEAIEQAGRSALATSLSMLAGRLLILVTPAACGGYRLWQRQELAGSPQLQSGLGM